MNEFERAWVDWKDSSVVVVVSSFVGDMEVEIERNETKLDASSLQRSLSHLPAPELLALPLTHPAQLPKSIKLISISNVNSKRTKGRTNTKGKERREEGRTRTGSL